MFPTQRASGIAGVLAGVGLAVEMALWTASGWTPQTWGDPQGALAFLRDNGGTVRAGVFAGVINLVFLTILIAGLTARLRDTAPTRAAATLHLGVIGVGAHSLVPIGLWLGIPMFLASTDATAAAGGWTGFAVFLAAAGGVGSLFLGLSTLAAGWAAATTKALPVWLGWVGILTGVATVATVLAAQTPLGSLAEAAYLPSLVLAIVFRTATGIHLMRSPNTVKV